MTDRHHHHDASLDRTMIDELAARDLVVRRIDDAVRADVDPWLEAVSRGFLDGERNETQREAFFAGSAYRRKIGVFDETAPLAEIPAATFASWATELTLPGGEVPACAISSVTVAPTHRRRGILRSVMAGELRTAIQRGLPVAILTVSESTIYGRFGYGPATQFCTLTVDARDARFLRPRPAGSVELIDHPTLRKVGPDLYEQVRRAVPGSISRPSGSTMSSTWPASSSASSWS
jgi:ribosomal protein S18 acetylase RimI-like enzyme